MKAYNVVLTRRAKNDIIFFMNIEETLSTVVVLRVGYNRRNWKEILLK